MQAVTNDNITSETISTLIKDNNAPSEKHSLLYDENMI
jgi:hypothetical protein